MAKAKMPPEEPTEDEVLRRMLQTPPAPFTPKPQPLKVHRDAPLRFKSRAKVKIPKWLKTDK